MKKSLFNKLTKISIALAASGLLAISAIAQTSNTPQGIDYMAVVNSAGNPYANQTINAKVTIYTFSGTFTPVFVETHSGKQTSASGVVSFVIEVAEFG